MIIRFAGALQIKAVGKSFDDLNQSEYVERTAILWDHPVRLAAYRNEKGELMVVAQVVISMSIFLLYIPIDGRLKDYLST